MFSQQKGRSAGGATGLDDIVCLAENDIKLVEKSSQTQAKFSNSREFLRLKQLAARLHSLGPAPLFYFLREIEAGADLRRSLEEYAVLPADLIHAYGGDQFAPALRAVDGGRS